MKIRVKGQTKAEEMVKNIEEQGFRLKWIERYRRLSR